MQVQLLVHLPTLAKELVLSFWIMCSVLVLRIGLWTVPAMELVSTIVHTLKMLESPVWVCVYLDHATQLVLDSMLIEYDFVRTSCLYRASNNCTDYRRMRKFSWSKIFVVVLLQCINNLQMKFSQMLATWRAPMQYSSDYFVWIIFSRYEYNCKYSENFVSAKFLVLG